MPYPNDCIKQLTKSFSANIHPYLELIRQGIDNGKQRSNNNLGVSKRVDDLQSTKTGETTPRSPIIANPNIDVNHAYRDFLLPNNFLPTPITPLSPITGVVPAQLNLEEERKRSSHQHEMVWSKKKRGNSLDSNDYNEQLKRIEFILARHFHSANGEKIGFPVFDINEELLGFFREVAGEGTFYPISTVENFDPRQAPEVKRVLEEAVSQQSDAVHRLSDCGTLASLFDHAMVYDWSREFSQHT